MHRKLDHKKHNNNIILSSVVSPDKIEGMSVGVARAWLTEISTLFSTSKALSVLKAGKADMPCVCWGEHCILHTSWHTRTGTYYSRLTHRCSDPLGGCFRLSSDWIYRKRQQHKHVHVTPLLRTMAATKKTTLYFQMFWCIYSKASRTHNTCRVYSRRGGAAPPPEFPPNSTPPLQSSQNWYSIV